MGKIFQRLLLLSGLVLYLFDYGSDIYVAYRYWQNGDVWWFRITVGFIIVPSIIVNITAIFQFVNLWMCLAATLQFSIAVRYIETMELLEPSRIYSLAKLRYLETITESAPQWCLQGYIMLRQWKFPKYTVFSMSLSLLSLAWSITSLEKARRGKREIEFGVTTGFCFVLWQLLTLITRLSVIVMVTYVFRDTVFIFLGIHWFVQTMVLLIIQIVLQSSFAFFKPLFLSLLASLPTMFHASETVFPTEDPTTEMIIGYIIILLENITMVTLSLTLKVPDAPHMDVLQPIAIAVIIVGSFFSICFSPSGCC